MTDSLFLVPDGPWEVGEPVAGLVHVLPYLLLALLLVIPLRSTHSPDGSQPPSRGERWLIRNLCCLALFSAVPVLVATGGAQNRYMVDVIPSLLLLAILGAWRGWYIFRHHRRVFSTLVVGLSLFSMLMGISLWGFWTHHTMPYRQKTPSEWYPPEPR